MKTLKQHQQELDETWGDNELELSADDDIAMYIMEFGFGMLKFHTADIQRLLDDKKALEVQLEEADEKFKKAGREACNILLGAGMQSYKLELMKSLFESSQNQKDES